MITGDHLNIAKETARLIGMGVNIHPGEATRDPTQERNELIRSAHGFAQVLPRDKREVKNGDVKRLSDVTLIFS
jgi:H+-transporting ATPase